MLNTGITLSALALCFIGCETEVDIVKKSSFKYINNYNEVVDYDPSFTISQAFDHRKSCSDVKWQTFEGNRGRKIVQYDCQLSSIDSVIYDWFDDIEEKEIQKETEKYNKLNSTINKYKGVEKKLKEAEENSENMTVFIMATHSLRSQADTYSKAKKNMDKEFPNGLEEKLSEIRGKYEKSILPYQVNEVYQWAISEEKEPIFVYNGYTVKLTDHKEIECRNDLLYSLENIYKNKDSKYYSSLINTLKNWTSAINFGSKGVIHLNDLKCNYS